MGRILVQESFFYCTKVYFHEFNVFLQLLML